MTVETIRTERAAASPEDAFEAAWHDHFASRQPVPNLQDFVPAADSESYASVLCNLIGIDLERRWCANSFQQAPGGSRETKGTQQTNLGTGNFVPSRPLADYLATYSIAADSPLIPKLASADYEARR